ncbi:lipopolysaccharide biosynthesis protein [Flavobacterium sp.]|uniref:lipopolysaccharide biosynthesis protein n=1 Tax=Flavobacterium sp. TaxID=239 RepID=UPI0038FCEA36
MSNKVSEKQAFFFTIINYVGIVIGVISTLFIYPNDKELLGIFRYIDAISYVLFPIMLIGASQALVNFTPKLDDLHKKKLFNYSIFSILIISSFILGLLFIISFIPAFKGMKYVYFAFPVALFLAFIELFKKQATIIQKIAVPTFLDNIIPKISLPIIFLLLLYHYITFSESVVFYIFSYGFILILLTIYLYKYFKPKFNLDFKSLFNEVSKRDYYHFSMYAFAGSLGSVFAFRIDALMIPKFISMEANGTFSIGVTLASALAIPATGVFALYAPIISNYLKTDNLSELNLKYKEISKLLFFIGALLYSCIFLGIENLFMILPTHEKLMTSIPIILILGFNVLVNMGTGFNSEIITYSKYYKFNLIAIAILIVLNVGLNLLFILYFNFEIEAVAVASLVSMVIFNFAKLLFIYKKFKLFPFDYNYLKLVLILVITLAVVYFLPKLINDIYTLVYKVSLSLFLNIFIIYKLKLVYQVNVWINKIINYTR